MPRIGLVVVLLASVVVAGCGNTRSSSVLAADLTAYCKESNAMANAAVAKAGLGPAVPNGPTKAQVLATVRKLAALKPSPGERIVLVKLLMNVAKLGKAIDSGHIAAANALVAPINREATQLHAPACKIAWP